MPSDLDVDGFAVYMRAIRAASLPGGVDPDAIALLLGGLRQLTDWDEDVLCRHLGCTGIDFEPVRASHSQAYLTWVTELCRLVDPSRKLVRSRREVVVGAFELCDGCGVPVPERVAVCRVAVAQPMGNSYSALTLLELGEVAEAFRQAARALSADSTARQAQDLLDRNTPALRRSHLHPRRLEILYSSGSEDVQSHIGATVAYRMDAHVRECSLCDGLVRELGLRPERATLVA